MMASRAAVAKMGTMMVRMKIRALCGTGGGGVCVGGGGVGGGGDVGGDCAEGGDGSDGFGGLGFGLGEGGGGRYEGE